MFIISYGFESYHPLIIRFGSLHRFGSDLVLIYSEQNFGALGSEPRPTFSGGPEFGCLVHTRVRMSFHIQPTVLSDELLQGSINGPNNLGVKAP